MAGNIKQSSSNMLRNLLPRHFFAVLVLVLALVSRPAAGSNYKVVLKSGSRQDSMKFMCYNFRGYNNIDPNRGALLYQWNMEFGHPITAYFQSWQRLMCDYRYQHAGELTTLILFDGDAPDQDCRAELGGCTFVVKGAVMYKKLRGGGTQIMGAVRSMTCKTKTILWLFDVQYCHDKPHQHPYVNWVATHKSAV